MPEGDALRGDSEGPDQPARDDLLQQPAEIAIAFVEGLRKNLPNTNRVWGVHLNPLQLLLARDAIRTLAVRYALAVDGKDLETLGDLFAPDVDNGRFGRGREGVRSFYDQSLHKFHCSVHSVGNHLIEFDDADRAHGVVYCHAQHHVLEPEHWFDEALAYWDTYERIDGEWCFRRRRVRSWYREHRDHPDLHDRRIVATSESTGPKRGGRMPEEFPSFTGFWKGSFSDPRTNLSEPT